LIKKLIELGSVIYSIEYYCDCPALKAIQEDECRCYPASTWFKWSFWLPHPIV